MSPDSDGSASSSPPATASRVKNGLLFCGMISLEDYGGKAGPVSASSFFPPADGKTFPPLVEPPRENSLPSPSCSTSSSDGSDSEGEKCILHADPGLRPHSARMPVSEDFEYSHAHLALRPHSARKLRKRTLPPLRGVAVEYETRQKAVLTDTGQVTAVWERRAVLREVPPLPPIDPLKLYLLHRIRNGQERPIMPCLDENFLDLNVFNRFGFNQLVRDRNKDWRELLWTDLAPNLRPAGALVASSCEDESFDTRPAPEKVFTDGVLINKTLLLREARMLGSTNVIISIFGMGIAGRVYFETVSSPRFLLFDAFVPSLLAKCELRIDTHELRSILGEDEGLLKPGLKLQLLSSLQRRLYVETNDQGETELKIRHGKLLSDVEARYNERMEARRLKREIEAYLASLPPPSPPPPRTQCMVFNSAAKINSYFVVVSIYNYPEQKMTYFVRVYEPTSSISYELPIGLLELLSVVGQEVDDVEEWDKAKWKSVFQKLMRKIVIKTWSGKGAIMVGRRIGLAGPALGQRRKVRRGAAVGNVLEMAKTLGRLQESLFKMSLKRGHHRRGAALHRKIPLRDIGSGRKLASGSVIICGYGMRFSCYLRAECYVLRVCEISSSCTGEIRMRKEGAFAMARGYLAISDDDDDDDDDEVFEENAKPPIGDVCRCILKRRVWARLLRRESGGLTLSLSLNRCIYRNGHSIPVLDPKSGEEKGDRRSTIVKVFQEFGAILFSAYDIDSRATYEYKVDDVLAMEMIEEYGTLEKEEVDIQIALNVSMMCLLENERTGNLELRYVPEDPDDDSSDGNDSSDDGNADGPSDGMSDLGSEYDVSDDGDDDEPIHINDI